MMNNICRVLSTTILMMVCLSAGADVRLMDRLEEPVANQGFSLPDLQGELHRVSDFRGKYLLVNFWAVWCKPCREEMPAMNALSRQFTGDDFEMIGIHVGPADAGMDRFLAEVPVDFKILVDAEISLSDWNVLGLPTTFLLDPDGRIIYRAVSEREWDAPEMIDFFQAIIKGEQA